MAASSSSSNHVYIQSEEHGWIPARLLESSDDGRATVSVGVYKSQQEMITEAGSTSKKTLQTVDLKEYPNNSLPLQNVDEDGKLKAVADLVDLDFLHEAAILYNLKVRHKHSKPYTRTGELIIAVNPFQWFHTLYSEEQRMYYANALVWDSDTATVVEPHVYETSCQAYRGLAMGENQSILVSGESGAGKTETVKILLSDIASVQAGSADHHQHSDIVQRVLDSNPLLEAFGNAKTVRNDNSSRFGKFIQLQFEVEDATQAAYRGRALPSCRMVGSECEVYLLEKIRVVNHEPEERTYHIFYQLLAAPDKGKYWQGLEGATTESFTYVGYSDTNTIEGKTDQERFQHTIDSLALVGIVDDQLLTLMRAICIVLVLGNVTFEDIGDDASKISSDDVLTSLAELLGVDEDNLRAALTIRSVRARGEVFQVPLKDTAAKDSCDAFAKEIYAQTFHWLVRKINTATSVSASNGNIGLLDIFGFESFETNRFEQLCINYANEKLQQKFTHDIFRSVQAEYEAEGIELDEITFEDNAPILEFIEGRMGLIALLKEECVRPGGSDKDFVSKTSAMHKEKNFFIREKSYDPCQFGIHHYAGRVIYDARQFVTRNMDTLPLDLQDCAKKSKNSIVANDLSRTGGPLKTGTPAKKAGGPPLKRKGSALVGETVSSKFRNQLGALMANLSTTRTRYIRCIKPNQEKKPLIMDHVSTVEQLRCAGVVAAVTISRSAFPNRLDHQVVLDRFRSLWHHISDDCDVSETVEKLLTTGLSSLETEKDGERVKGFVMGKTRAYFRAGSLEYLEKERLKALSVRAIEIQRAARKFLAQSSFQRWKRLSIRIQSAIRMSLARSAFKTKRIAAIRLQCWARCRSAGRFVFILRRNYKACIIQSQWRRLSAMSRLRSSRNAVIFVQKIARGSLQRPKFRAALIEKREEAKLENQVLALQRKLEEAEKRRLEAEKKAEASVVASNGVAAAVGEALHEEKKEVDSEASSLTGNEVNGMSSQQQHTLMDESGKMLEYLRKEVFKLRSHNARLRRDYDLLKGNNQRLMDANASAGASFAALNQHAKHLQKTNDKISVEYESSKAQVQKLSITQVELKEELKMKQATYIAEVHSRLQYQRALSRIIDVAQAKGGDSRLVDEILRIADACEAEYMNGPTGISPRKPGLFSTPTSTHSRPTVSNDSGIMSSIRKIWS